MSIDRAELRKRIVREMYLEDIRAACNDLGINYQSLEGQTLGSKAISLIDYMAKRGRLSELEAWIDENLNPKSRNLRRKQRTTYWLFGIIPILVVTTTIFLGVFGNILQVVPTPTQPPIAHVETSTPITTTITIKTTVTSVPTATRTITPIYSGLILGKTAELYTSPAIPDESGGVSIGTPLGLIEASSVVGIIGRSGDNFWFEIRVSDGRVGWVEASRVVADDRILANVPTSPRFPKTIQLSEYVVFPVDSCGISISILYDQDHLRVFWSGGPEFVRFLQMEVIDNDTGQTIFFPSSVDIDNLEGFSIAYDQGHSSIEVERQYTLNVGLLDENNRTKCRQQISIMRNPLNASPSPATEQSVSPDT